nr:MAG TPA: hypothetical protein [Caudoviricetes sp.]
MISCTTCFPPTTGPWESCGRCGRRGTGGRRSSGRLPPRNASAGDSRGET